MIGSRLFILKYLGNSQKQTLKDKHNSSFACKAYINFYILYEDNNNMNTHLHASKMFMIP